MHNVRTPAGREALDSDILHHLADSSQKEPMSMGDLAAKLGGEYTNEQIRARLVGLIEAEKVGKLGQAVATRYFLKAKGRKK